jgi:hypothetical protein
MLVLKGLEAGSFERASCLAQVTDSRCYWPVF